MPRVVVEDDSLREARCGWCWGIFYVCRQCDRGQAYCTVACRVAKRNVSNRASRRRHQQTREGRLDNASRQAAYRARKKVTDQGIAESSVSGTVPPQTTPSSASTAAHERSVESMQDVQTPSPPQTERRNYSTPDDLRQSGAIARGVANASGVSSPSSVNASGRTIAVAATTSPRCSVCGCNRHFVRFGTLRRLRVWKHYRPLPGRGGKPA